MENTKNFIKVLEIGDAYAIQESSEDEKIAAFQLVAKDRSELVEEIGREIFAQAEIDMLDSKEKWQGFEVTYIIKPITRPVFE